jgi:hypothetical protein
VTDAPLVPPEFTVPTRHECAGYRLEPLGPEHNAADFAAWTRSIDHIRALPDFAGSSWPDPRMSAEDNLRDLQRHRGDFDGRRGFTYTVLDVDGDVAGCLYLYPDRSGGTDVRIRSWLRVDHADREADFRSSVVQWMTDAWPFRTWLYGAASG